MASDWALTLRIRRALHRGTIVRAVLLGLALYPALYLVWVVPHRGWIDFNQIFSGVQALWRGDNPYLGLYYYPPWTALPLAPLLLLPYDPGAGRFEAAEAWFWLNLAAYLGAMMLWLPAIGVRLRSLDGALLAAGGLVFAPTLQSLIHGQSIILLLLAMAVLGTPRGRHPLIAGLALALLTMKPQVGGPVLGGVLLRALVNRSFGVIGGFAAAMGIALAGSFLLRPTWPWDWLTKLSDGHLFTEGSPALDVMLLDLGVPSLLALGIALSIAAPCAVWYAWRAWQGRGQAPDPDFIATGAAVGVLIAIYNHSYDYVLMLLPAILGISRLGALPLRHRWLFAAGLVVAYFMPLGRFVNLIPGQFTLLSGLVVAVVLFATRASVVPGTLPSDPEPVVTAGALER